MEKNKRGRAYKRQQRERVIQKKVYIYTIIWGNELGFARGRYAKGKVHCSCRLCKFESFHHIEKEKYKNRTDVEKEVADYFSGDD